MLRGPVRALAEGPTGTPPAPSRFGDFWPIADGLVWGAWAVKADVPINCSGCLFHQKQATGWRVSNGSSVDLVSVSQRGQNTERKQD